MPRPNARRRQAGSRDQRRLRRGSARSSAEELNAPLLRVAFAPETGWSSWEWIAGELRQAWEGRIATSIWDISSPLEADAIIFVKFLPELALLRELHKRVAVLYCPVDRYGSAAEIDADALSLRQCDRVIVHAPSLRRYFLPYSLVELMDHPVRFVRPTMCGFKRSGPVLWVGRRDNLEPLAQWYQVHSPDFDLVVLTDLDDSEGSDPERLGFGGSSRAVRVEPWSVARHLEYLGKAKAAIDIKGTDFRQAHKPAAKAVDYLAAGLPLAMNPDSAAHAYLAALGFDLVTPQDMTRWQSRGYWAETARFGAALRELYSRERIAWRTQRIVEMVLRERGVSQGP